MEFLTLLPPGGDRAECALNASHRVPFIVFLDRDVIDRSLLHFFYIRSREQHPLMADMCFEEAAKTTDLPPRRSKERAIFSQMEKWRKGLPKISPTMDLNQTDFFQRVISFYRTDGRMQWQIYR